MARPRSLSDEQVLDRIGAAFGEADTVWTLAGAAAAAGLHPATLIKRFGSRHGLLLALSRHWIQAIPTSAATPDAHGELLAWASSPSTGQESSAQLLARVEMLGEDLRDDELRLLLHQGWTKHINFLSDLVQRSQDHGHLASRLPAETIACLLLDAAHGGLLRAAAHPHPAQAHPGRTLTGLDIEQARKVYLDGGQVVTAFLAAELIEELTISRAPVILGAGLPLFHNLPHPVRLAHLGTSTTESGMTNTRYRVAAASDT